MAVKKTTRGKTVSALSGTMSEGKRKSLANLKPFPKGVSGNPGGEPRKPVTILRDALLARLAEAIVKGEDVKSVAEMLALTITDEALKGNTRIAAFNAIANVVQPTQIEHSGKNGGAIEVIAHDYRTAIAALTVGSVEDSDAPGADQIHMHGETVG